MLETEIRDFFLAIVIIFRLFYFFYLMQNNKMKLNEEKNEKKGIVFEKPDCILQKNVELSQPLSFLIFFQCIYISLAIIED